MHRITTKDDLRRSPAFLRITIRRLYIHRYIYIWWHVRSSGISDRPIWDDVSVADQPLQSSSWSQLPLSIDSHRLPVRPVDAIVASVIDCSSPRRRSSLLGSVSTSVLRSTSLRLRRQRHPFTPGGHWRRWTGWRRSVVIDTKKSICISDRCRLVQFWTASTEKSPVTLWYVSSFIICDVHSKSFHLNCVQNSKF